MTMTVNNQPMTSMVDVESNPAELSEALTELSRTKLVVFLLARTEASYQEFVSSVWAVLRSWPMGPEMRAKCEADPTEFMRVHENLMKATSAIYVGKHQR